MADTQCIVDDVRAYVQAGDPSFRDSLPPLATAYAAACKEVNDRLRRCDDFLRKGLRSEAKKALADRRQT